MTKIDIFSGFLGAGKTTLIKKLISEAYCGEKLVLIENEFGEIGVDASFLSEAGINITEMNSGCICCSLVGDFGRALKKVISDYSPDRILIEPSGVGKLSDVITAVRDAAGNGAVLNSAVTVADAKKCRMYMKNFGEFFNNQIENASVVILSHTDGLTDDKIAKCIEMIREHNKDASLVTTAWNELDGADILKVIEGVDTLEAELERLEVELEHPENETVCPSCGELHNHHHHDDDECDEEHHHHDDDECDEEHHHHDDDECDEEHHHHDDDECDEEHHHHHDDECEDEHHHHDDEECSCGCNGEHHHHHADEVFKSWGIETARRYTKEEIKAALCELENQEKYGMVLRAKGIVATDDGWIHFDYTPGEPDVRDGKGAATGRLCVIGSGINEAALVKLLG